MIAETIVSTPIMMLKGASAAARELSDAQDPLPAGETVARRDLAPSVRDDVAKAAEAGSAEVERGDALGEDVARVPVADELFGEQCRGIVDARRRSPGRDRPQRRRAGRGLRG